MSFIAVNGFETKISAGGAITSVSRDMLRLMRSFDIFRLLSFYSSMAGFYITTLMSMWSVYLYALCQLILCIMRLETYEQFEYADEATSDAPGPRVSPTMLAKLVQFAREDPGGFEALCATVRQKAQS